jgi:hypothetical protein
MGSSAEQGSSMRITSGWTAMNDLQSDWQPIGVEAAGQAQPADARQVHREGEYVGQVHLQRVIWTFSPMRKAVVGVSGSDHVHLGRRASKSCLDEGAHLLGLEVVGVVIAGGEGIGAQHDAPFDLRPEALPGAVRR